MTPTDRSAQGSTLFTVRLWLEEFADSVEVRGTVRHLSTGITLHFREWKALEDFFLRVLQGEAE